MNFLENIPINELRLFYVFNEHFIFRVVNKLNLLRIQFKTRKRKTTKRKLLIFNIYNEQNINEIQTQLDKCYIWRSLI